MKKDKFKLGSSLETDLNKFTPEEKSKLDLLRALGGEDKECGNDPETGLHIHYSQSTYVQGAPL